MHFPRWLVLWIVAGLLLPACADEEPARRDALSVHPVEPPVAPGSHLPFLQATSEGAVVLSWVEPAGGDSVALRYAVWREEAWSEPRTIAAAADWFVNWADFPSLLVNDDGSMAAHFLQKSGPATYAYDVRVTQSADGRTWTPPITPHTDATPTEHGFVSMLPWTEGRVLLAWLDGRNTGGGHDGGGAMTIRAALLDAAGQLHDEVLLDARVCDCCQTAAARTTHGAVVAYRDRSEAEVRDIAVVRWQEGQWREPVRVHADDWTIAGCPVNGPALDAQGEHVALAWFTAAGEVPRVKLAFSEDEGATFSMPVVVDDGNPLGRVDVALLPDGSVVVSWLEVTEAGAEVRIRRILPDGTALPSTVVAATSAARSSGFPRLAATGADLYVAWTEAGEPSVVRMAQVEMGD